MAPLPQNNTARLFFDYVTGSAATSVEHTVQMRISGAEGTQTTGQEQFLSFLNAFGPGAFRTGWKVQNVRYSAAGSSFSLPIAILPALGSFLGTHSGTYVARYEAVEETIQGRSPVSGRRVDLSIYRAFGDANPSFRTGLPAGVQTALSAGLTAGVWRAIDGSTPIFYTFLNSNYNSYWETRLRTV